MTASQIVDEIKRLALKSGGRVVGFLYQLDAERRLGEPELSTLAERSSTPRTRRRLLASARISCVDFTDRRRCLKICRRDLPPELLDYLLDRIQSPEIPPNSFANSHNGLNTPPRGSRHLRNVPIRHSAIRIPQFTQYSSLRAKRDPLGHLRRGFAHTPVLILEPLFFEMFLILTARIPSRSLFTEWLRTSTLLSGFGRAYSGLLPSSPDL